MRLRDGFGRGRHGQRGLIDGHREATGGRRHTLEDESRGVQRGRPLRESRVDVAAELTDAAVHPDQGADADGRHEQPDTP